MVPFLRSPAMNCPTPGIRAEANAARKAFADEWVGDEDVIHGMVRRAFRYWRYR
jgi:hypothetical protein